MLDHLCYLLSSMAWSFGGLVGGFYLGRCYASRKKDI